MAHGRPDASAGLNERASSVRREIKAFGAIVAGAFLVGACVAVAEDRVVVDLAHSRIGEPPANFDFQETGEQGDAGDWRVIADETAPGGRAIEHASADPREDRYSLAIYRPISTENAEVAVRFKIVSGALLSAGIAIGVRNPDNYYVVRASALEQSVELVLVRNGTVQWIDGNGDGNVQVGRWHELRVKLDDDHFAVRLDDRLMFTTFDRARMKDGRVALWTWEDSVTRFDRMEIKPLPNTEWR
jgi:hypothetical protein